MNNDLSSFAARLREAIPQWPPAAHRAESAAARSAHGGFSELALELFALQFRCNPVYAKICEARGLTPNSVEHWTQIPHVPTGAFKELELSCLPPGERTAVFHSSGTTEQKPSRHFHGVESLAVYEMSLWTWFAKNVLPWRSAGGSPACSQVPGGTGFQPVKSGILPDFERTQTARTSTRSARTEHPDRSAGGSPASPMFLTPPPGQAPHSSLVHMFETVRENTRGPEIAGAFFGHITSDGTWTIHFDAALRKLESACAASEPLLLLGTAFSFVHLLDFLAEQHRQFALPVGSRVMETGGYKNRSRVLPKSELHGLITQRLGIAREDILCEYGMSELSSQAYDSAIEPPTAIRHRRVFRFPPWARVQIVSPETVREVADGETGLIRIFDLANVFSVAAIQTEDLGIRHGDGFELIGRAQLAEPRGCSLMTA